MSEDQPDHGLPLMRVPLGPKNPVDSKSELSKLKRMAQSRPMITAESIQQAVEQLSPEELVRFRLWFSQFDADAWDIQIEADAAAGKLDAHADEAIIDYQSGKTREL